MAEIWKKVRGFPGYDVSSMGRVRSWKSGGRGGKTVRKKPLIMSFSFDKDGYETILLVLGNKRPKRRVHRLVLLAFVGPPPAGMSTSHLNGHKADNRLKNICWESMKDNCRRKHAHGTAQIGERNAHAKLTDKDILAIRDRHLRGETQESIAKYFGVTRPNIGYIIRRETWRHI